MNWRIPNGLILAAVVSAAFWALALWTVLR